MCAYYHRENTHDIPHILITHIMKGFLSLEIWKTIYPFLDDVKTLQRGDESCQKCRRSSQTKEILY